MDTLEKQNKQQLNNGKTFFSLSFSFHYLQYLSARLTLDSSTNGLFLF